ncbi:multicopper oxidase domain-containing protein [Neobacillus mesonae]|uniref:multicopper oxidase domain-containing protein n=1 Tax=Neobacillus mesonae TaxID=1193713 RepID=UPI00288BD79F|nr:multicopper oxidase domain-containing protein [Neobacillus mesonae]
MFDRNGDLPPANEAGWKDTILVYPGEKVRAVATFNLPGVFMYHCHILEHEDAGMMGQFKVE